MPKNVVVYFDSQASAASTLGLDIYEIREAKSEGCSAFRSGRVYKAPLLDWIESKRARQRVRHKAANGDSDSLKALRHATCKTVSALAAHFEHGALTFDKYLTTGNAIVNAIEDSEIFEDSDIVLMFCGLTHRAVRAKYPTLEAAKETGDSRILVWANYSVGA